jgi:hypothetical protein
MSNEGSTLFAVGQRVRLKPFNRSVAAPEVCKRAEDCWADEMAAITRSQGKQVCLSLGEIPAA